DVAGIEAVVLEHADQVGVTGTGPGHPAAADLPGALGCHHVLPVSPIAVGDEHGYRGAQGLPGPNPRQPLDLVLLDFHPGSATVALHPPGEFVVDPGGVDAETRGKAFHDGQEALPM